MHSLLESHLYDVCKVIEIVAGAALLLGLWVPLALILEAPVTMIIFYMSVFMTGSPRTTFTGVREVILNFGLLTAYWGYFRSIFLSPCCRWTQFGGAGSSRRRRPS
jgi:uncharacterized membrane protein YphA (DoxX/SURF4 family)